MTRRTAICLTMAFGLVGFACGGSKAGSCILADACIEYDGAGFTMPEASCELLGLGTWVDGACSHLGAVGGCREPRAAGAKYTVTTWYYSAATDGGAGKGDGGTADGGSGLCAGGTTFIEP